MRTIDDINFDRNYLHPTIRFLLLDDLTTNRVGPTPVIPLPNALLMTFVNVYNNLMQCQLYIRNENRKMIKLCISNRNIMDWDNLNNEMHSNVNEVYIFCDTFYDYTLMQRWNGCYQDKIRGVYLPDQVDHKLLKLGIDYIYSILPEFQEDRGLSRIFRADARRLLDALREYFQDQMDENDDDDD
ncbi:unnamed protein product [Rotaria socialis]|uniref:Uncharacterized protein n=1 Tax=Rotaria socialis TaxID=392032 RepID=A0A818A7U5_9BILA|nr:unnamed protein product [Rotaria socialis]CAF3409172.1 unnamed protein product [Rotaria socialis]CAF3423700.1 unnamed protein product [Rotaria socialis]CAF4255559.1 unnamed protein product [Rotaria socialis]CAF4310729.1 unnamed protein product [Rotaria socialis]